MLSYPAICTPLSDLYPLVCTPMSDVFPQVQAEHTLPPDHHNSTLLYKSNPQEVRPLVPGLEFRPYKDILLLESMGAASAELAYYRYVYIYIMIQHDLLRKSTKKYIYDNIYTRVIYVRRSYIIIQYYT